MLMERKSGSPLGEIGFPLFDVEAVNLWNLFVDGCNAALADGVGLPLSFLYFRPWDGRTISEEKWDQIITWLKQAEIKFGGEIRVEYYVQRDAPAPLEIIMTGLQYEH